MWAIRACCWWIWVPAATGWAARSSPRCTPRWEMCRRIWIRRRCWQAWRQDCGLVVELPEGSGGLAGRLFAEELGAVVQVRAADVKTVQALFSAAGLDVPVHDIGAPQQALTLKFRCGAQRHEASWQTLRQAWSEVSHRMRLLRDAPDCAREEFGTQLDAGDPGLDVRLSFDAG